MCADRIQRLLMAIVLLVATYLMSIANIWGFVLQGFVIVMITIWAFTDFCPSTWMLKKFSKPCSCKE